MSKQEEKAFVKLQEKPKGKGKYYLTNQDLLPAVIEAKEKGYLTDRLARMLMMLADKYSRKSNFIGYSFREDMVSVALLNLVQKALSFDPEKSNNPFSYYTTAIHHSFLQYMADEKKHRDIRDNLLVDAGADPSFNYADSVKKKEALKEKKKAEAAAKKAAKLAEAGETPKEKPSSTVQDTGDLLDF